MVKLCYTMNGESSAESEIEGTKAEIMIAYAAISYALKSSHHFFTVELITIAAESKKIMDAICERRAQFDLSEIGKIKGETP